MIESSSRWIVENPTNSDAKIELNISTIVKELLIKRGIDNTEEARKFLEPKLEDLHDPFLFPDMEKAIERIEQAIQNRERILVFGDYDADGVTSTSLLVEALREKDAYVDYYIPNRFTEGYGPNEAAFRQAKLAEVSLIITVDTGIAAVHEANVAKELGIDLIITDHHEAQEELPNAYAIIHPKLANTYPFDELAGVGVAFKLAHALLGELPLHLIELASIGTVADLVPLKDENRIIVYYGLKALTSTQRPGLKVLKELSGISGTVTEEHIGFGIGPRLNAVGRLQDATVAVELILEDDMEIATEMAEEVDRLNEERQKLVGDIANEAKKIITDNHFDQQSVLIVAKEGWNPGVVGIVASRLVNTYNKPAIVLGIDAEKGIAKGSARSIPAFNLFENCLEVKDLFVSFGGHSQAAGMTLTIENVDKLRDALNQIASEKLTAEDFIPITPIDMKVDMGTVSMETIEEVEKLAPFGMGNPKPIFQFEQEIPNEIRQIGSKLNHLKMNFQKDGTLIDVIGFGKGGIFHELSPKSKVALVGELGINEWNGRKKMQIMLKDLMVKEWQLFDYRGSKHSVKQLAENLDDRSIVALHFKPLDSEDLWMNETFQCYQIEDFLTRNMEVEELFIVDLPTEIEELEKALSRISPKKIYVYFKTSKQSFLSQLPTREHFKQFYAFMMKQKELKVQDRLRFAHSRGWSKDFVDFIIKVFLELQFVKIDNGNLIYNPNPIKQDLTEASTYQVKQKEIIAEKVLYYSTYDELKTWFSEHMKASNLEEAVLNGL